MEKSGYFSTINSTQLANSYVIKLIFSTGTPIGKTPLDILPMTTAIQGQVRWQDKKLDGLNRTALNEYAKSFKDITRDIRKGVIKKQDSQVRLKRSAVKFAAAFRFNADGN